MEDDGKGEGKIAATITHDAIRVQQGDEGSPSSSGPFPPPTPNRHEVRSKLESFTKNLIDPQTGSNNREGQTEECLKELKELYTRQMVLRDKVTKNIENIKVAKERSGRVPFGMQIKVTPEVLGNNDMKFKHNSNRSREHIVLMYS